jgi:hypothetical protein
MYALSYRFVLWGKVALRHLKLYAYIADVAEWSKAMGIMLI